MLQGLVVIWGAITVTFLLARVAGDASFVIGGTYSTPEQRAAIREQLGLNRSPLEQYLGLLGHVWQLDFGVQYRTGEAALSPVLAALPYTGLLVTIAVLVGVAIAVPMAMYSVLRRGTVGDRVLQAGTALAQGVPEFWLALLLISLFAVTWPVLPSFGYRNLSSVVLPAAALAIPLVPALMRLTRVQLLDVMATDFVLALRAKGLSDRRIIARHGLRNVAAPVISLVALQIGWLLAGALIVESIFAWPGIGTLVITAVNLREFTVVQTVVIFVAAAYVVLNLVADLLVAWLDPRVRLSGKES